jgi:hypothetical protein
MWIAIALWLIGWAVTVGVTLYMDWRDGDFPDLLLLCVGTTFSLLVWPALAIAVMIDCRRRRREETKD